MPLSIGAKEWKKKPDREENIMFKYKTMKDKPKFNLQLFADDNADQDANVPGDNTETQTDTDTDKKSEEEKVYKQQDVNNIVAKESKKATEKLLKELGIEDFDNAKDGLAKFKKWQEDQKTEEQKKDEALENLEKDKQSLSTENSTLKAQLAALKQGVIADSVEDVVALAERLVSDEKTIDEAIKEVIEKYPHFAAQEEDKEDKPFFTTKQSNTNKDNDPFASKLAKYN